MVLPAAVRPVGVRDVACGLFEVGHEAAPLEHLGQNVRRAFAREVHAAQLGHGVVAVVGEDALVQLLGARGAHGARHRGAGRLLDELVEEEPAQRLGRARVAREERALDDLGEVDQREDGTIEVREVRGERGPFVGAERVHADILACVPRAGRPAREAALTPWNSAWDNPIYASGARGDSPSDGDDQRRLPVDEFRPRVSLPQDGRHHRGENRQDGAQADFWRALPGRHRQRRRDLALVLRPAQLGHGADQGSLGPLQRRRQGQDLFLHVQLSRRHDATQVKETPCPTSPSSGTPAAPRSRSARSPPPSPTPWSRAARPRPTRSPSSSRTSTVELGCEREIGLRLVARLKVGFIPIEGGHYYTDALEEVVRGEDLGFASVWMEEHHSFVNHYWPSLLPVLAGFATRTSRVILGTDILVAPFYHPVRLAEDAAMIDVMSAGRFVLGAAIGYKPDEFALYGAELEKRGARFEEQLAIIKGLWTQESLTFKGRYYQVEGALEPKPVATPHPPIWIGGWGDLTLKRAATLADNWIPGPTADLPRLTAAKKAFLDNRAAAGRTAAITEWPLTRDVIIADTDQRARELAEKHIMVSYRRE